MFLKEISSHASQVLNTVLEYNPPKHSLPIAGVVMVSALFFFYIRRFNNEIPVKKGEIGDKNVTLIRRCEERFS